MAYLDLKTTTFNSWEFNIPVDELHGLIYVADSESGDVIMSEIMNYLGEIIDVEIIGIADDFTEVTVSTGTHFEWGETKCLGFNSLREASLEFMRG